MTKLASPPTGRAVSWPLVLTLAVVALVRPLLSITGLADEWGKPATPLLATLAITSVWVWAVVATRQREPVLTLVLVGVTYAVLATVLSAALSPIVHGELQGPLARPAGLVGVLSVNALWGMIAGLMALPFRRR